MFTFSKRLAAALAALLLSCNVVPQLSAQVLYGSIVGTVLDESHTSIPDAKVRVLNKGTEQAREAQTDPSGSFSFPSLPGGIYDITVTKTGFRSYTVAGVNVTGRRQYPRRCRAESRDHRTVRRSIGAATSADR